MQVTMRALDGIQGPTANYASCCFRRQALYGHKPPSHTTESTRSKAISFLFWATGQLSTPLPRLSVLDGSVLRLVLNLDAEGKRLSSPGTFP